MPRIGAIGIVCALAAALVASAAAHEINLHKLPLGDGKISHTPKRGWIWACRVDPNAGGARGIGPWIDERDRTYDLTAKIPVRGAVTRHGHSFKVAVQGDKRVIASDDLPLHPTGQFPISPSDPAYCIDTNPNRIRRQNIRIVLPAHPRLAARAHCAPGAVGILLTGVPLFNALDAPGRDAVAHETQDRCHGHPQESGVYHYHSLTNCIDNKPGAAGNSPLVGYAIDGFGIYEPCERGKQLTSADLDARHGKVSEVMWDGRKVKMYHYVATVDFPYTVGCLRGTFDRSVVRAISGPPPRPARLRPSSAARFRSASPWSPALRRPAALWRSAAALRRSAAVLAGIGAGAAQPESCLHLRAVIYPSHSHTNFYSTLMTYHPCPARGLKINVAQAFARRGAIKNFWRRSPPRFQFSLPNLYVRSNACQRGNGFDRVNYATVLRHRQVSVTIVY